MPTFNDVLKKFVVETAEFTTRCEEHIKTIENRLSVLEEAIGVKLMITDKPEKNEKGKKV